MFVVFEGIDGAGKSTLLHALAERLEKQRFLVFTLHNPKHTPFYSALQQPLDLYTKLFTLASCHSYIAQKVKSYQQNKAIVLVDRYIYSSIAYQQVEGLPADLIWKACLMAVNNFLPDVAFLLDLSVDEAYKRKPEVDKNFFSQVRENYLKMKDFFIVVDATQDIQKTLSFIEGEILSLAYSSY